jgi:hypothetical protein
VDSDVRSCAQGAPRARAQIWPQAEISAVVGLATALLVVITALFARSQVTPT